MEELASYQEGYAAIVVSLDGDELVFWTDFDDNGRSIVTESRIAVTDYVAKGEGPWPWYDLGAKRPGAVQVLEALGVSLPAWTEPLPADALALFDRARNGWSSVAESIAAGIDPDVLDACGATPLWYAVRALNPAAALTLIDGGADASRRIALSGNGDRFTTILHEIVALGRVEAAVRALRGGAAPSVRDSDGATPLHVLGDRSDHLNPDLVKALVAAGADVNAQTSGGRHPIEVAAQRLLPASVATMLDLGADPAEALTVLLAWWAMNARWYGYRAKEVIDVIEILCAGGAVVTDRHRELVLRAGVDAVARALGVSE